jgi:hypothetical protein
LLQYVHFGAKHFLCAVLLQKRRIVLFDTSSFEEFQQKFPDCQGIYQQLAQKVYKCVNMFLETCSVLRKKDSGRPSKRTAENIEEVEQRIAETPDKSIRRLTQETNLSFGIVQLILKKDLHFFPNVCLLCMKLNLLTAPTT